MENFQYTPLSYDPKGSLAFSEARNKHAQDTRSTLGYYLAHFMAPYQSISDTSLKDNVARQFDRPKTYSDVEKQFELQSEQAGYKAFRTAVDEGQYMQPENLKYKPSWYEQPYGRFQAIAELSKFQRELQGELTPYGSVPQITSTPLLPSAEMYYDRDSAQNFYQLQDQQKKLIINPEKYIPNYLDPEFQENIRVGTENEITQTMRDVDQLEAFESILGPQMIKQADEWWNKKSEKFKKEYPGKEITPEMKKGWYLKFYEEAEKQFPQDKNRPSTEWDTSTPYYGDE